MSQNLHTAWLIRCFLCGHPDQASQRRVRLPARPIARAHDRRPEHQRASAKAPGMHDDRRGARQWDRFGSSRAPLLRCERRVAALQRCQRRRELAVPLLLHLQSTMRPVNLPVYSLLQPTMYVTLVCACLNVQKLSCPPVQ